MGNSKTINFFGFELVEDEAKLLKEFYKNNDFLTKRRNKNLEKTIQSLFKRKRIITKDGHVVEIEMPGETIESFPKEISYFKNLREVNLAANKFSNIPKEFYKLENLTYITVRNYCIGEVQGISGLKNLEVLDLYSCAIYSFPKEVTKLENLKRLNLGSNWGKYIIPAEISKMKSLEELELYETKLKSISRNILKLENLKKLDIRHDNMDYKIIPIVDKLEEKGVEVYHRFDKF
ncbi:MAG: hypothetical protein P8X70_02465 [Nanoarchaeota archaeon]